MDSFKGCLSAREASEAVAQGLIQSYPGIEIEIVEISDGGESLLESLRHCGDMEMRRIATCDALKRGIESRYLSGRMESNGLETSIVEMSQSAGLTLLRHEERNPWFTTTYGVGQILREALRGTRRVILGLGGSATNDAGLGALQALGARFMDSRGKEISEPICGRHLAEIADIDLDGMKDMEETEWILACDVDAEFTGETGASRVYAPQKGADPVMVERLETGMRHMEEVFARRLGIDIRGMKGMGAAGGMSGGVYAVMKSLGAGIELKRGIDISLDANCFDAKIEDADLIVTGEGSIDRQTLQGKTAMGVMRRGKARGMEVAILAGKVSDADELRRGGFARVIDINAGYGKDEDMEHRFAAAKERIIKASARML